MKLFLGMKSSRPFCIGTTVIVVASMLLSASTLAMPARAATTYNYGEALQKALYFYEEQRSGALPANNRVPWKGNSGMNDGSDNGVDLTGGWYDAGDHVKFGLPMASTTTMLAWGIVDYRQAYANAGLLNTALDEIKWATDYFIKAHTAPNVLYGQVGDPSTDHAWWGPAEVMQMARPSYKISTSCPGSDLAGQTAAAMAASSIAFRPTNPSYADTLLTNAEQLYSFADAYRGKYDACMPVSGFYTSYSGYNDELVWGAIWLYRAEEAKSAGSGASYLTKAEFYYANLGMQGQSSVHEYKWTQSWDDNSYGSYVLLAKLTGQTQYMQDAQRWLDWWTVGASTAEGGDGTKISYTPGGLAYLDVWGPLRYAANTSFIALDYADYLGTSNSLYSRYHDFAVSQINYMLGSNPLNESYMVGFGSKYPQNIHHRTSHGSWTNDITNPTYQRHILFGALVGGPSSDDSFTDDRQQYQHTEPADDYNAGLSGALVRLYQEYGGTPLASFPPPDKAKDDDEYYVMAAVNSSGTNYTEIKAYFINKSSWPARLTDKLSLRYYFTLEPGVSISQITLNQNYSECGSNIISGPPVQWSGSTYYITVSCVGTPIYPGGQSQYRKEVQFRLTSSGAWDPTNDWSYTGVATPSGSTPVKSKRHAAVRQRDQDLGQ